MNVTVIFLRVLIDAGATFLLIGPSTCGRMWRRPTSLGEGHSMSRILGILIVLCALLLGACDNKPTDTSDHLLKEHKRALDKAKEVDKLTREAAERQRKVME
jgi:hypothetical protein